MASGPGNDPSSPDQEPKCGCCFTLQTPRAAPADAASPPPPCVVEHAGEKRIPGIGGSSTAAVDREGKNAAVLSRSSSSHGSTGSTSSADAAEAEETATASSPPPSPSPPFEWVHERPGEGSDRKGKAAVPSPASCSRGSTFCANADADEQLALAMQETDFLGMLLGAADGKQMIWPQGRDSVPSPASCSRGSAVNLFSNTEADEQLEEKDFLGMRLGAADEKQMIWPQDKDESFFSQMPGRNKLKEDTSENGRDEIFSNNRKLGNKIALMEFACKYKNNSTFMRKFMVLHESYSFVRQTDGDGSCFYRSFIFSYLEKAMAIADKDVRANEAIRLRKCIESGMQSCYLGLHRMTYARFERSFSGSEFVVKLVEDGLAGGELYERELTESITSRILPLLRSLTEIELCTRESHYKWFLTDHTSISELCDEEVCADDGETTHVTIQALVNALGITTVMGYVDMSKGGVEIVVSPGSGNVSPVAATVLYVPGHYDVLYVS